MSRRSSLRLRSRSSPRSAANGQTVIVRKASPEDASRLAVLGAALFRQTYEKELSSRDIVEHVALDFNEKAQLAELEDPDIETLLVEDHSGLAGFAQVRRRIVPIDGIGANVELWRIYVDRRLHGRGAGQQLLVEAGRISRAMSAQGIWLAVWEQNPRAIAFYRKSGFRPVGEQSFKVGGQIHRDLVMVSHPNAF